MELFQDRAQQPQDRLRVREDPHHIEPSSELPVQALQGVGGVDLPPVLRGEVHVREDFLGGLLEHVGDLGEPALQGGADLVQLPPGRRPVPLRRRWSGPEPL